MLFVGVQMPPSQKIAKTIDLVKISPYIHPYDTYTCTHNTSAPPLIYSFATIGVAAHPHWQHKQATACQGTRPHAAATALTSKLGR
jgi:hypothetical protein